LDIFGGGWKGGDAAKLHGFPAVPMDILQYLPILVRGYGVSKLAQRCVEHLRDALHQGERFSADWSGLDNVRVHGLVEGPIDRVFGEHCISLGFSLVAGRWTRTGFCRSTQGRLRDFEVTSAGGFYLVQEHPDIATFFRLGVEVETWRDIGQLEDKARYFLDNPARAEAIGRAARERCLREHTWRHRFATLLQSYP
jgi:hypothetical protein